MKAKKIISIIIIVFVLSGCAAIKQFFESAIREYNRTNNILETTVSQLGAQSNNWRYLLESAINDLPFFELKIKNDLRELIHSAEMIAGAEIRCTEEYTVNMLIFKIKEILAVRNHQPLPVPVPKVCSFTPLYIDMGDPIALTRPVTISGYSFLSGNFKLYHCLTTGSNIDVTSYMTVNTDYTMTVDIPRIPFGTQSQFLKITSGTDNFFSINITQAPPPICDKRSEDITLTPVILIADHKKHPNASRKGDAEFDGNGPCMKMWVRLYLKNNNTEIWYDAYIKAFECHDDLDHCCYDYTYGDVTKSGYLKTVNPGWKINRILSSTYCYFEYIDSNTDPETKTGEAPVLNWQIIGDTGGDDINGDTRVTIEFRPLPVELIQTTGGCVPN